MGKHGLSVDNLRSADVVTADGTFRTVHAEVEPDLFWALRGGGGNFGVVVSFEYDLHPVDVPLDRPSEGAVEPGTPPQALIGRPVLLTGRSDRPTAGPSSCRRPRRCPTRS